HPGSRRSWRGVLRRWRVCQDTQPWHPRSIAKPISCQEARLFNASFFPCTPTSITYTLREIERRLLWGEYATPCYGRIEECGLSWQCPGPLITAHLYTIISFLLKECIPIRSWQRAVRQRLCVEGRLALGAA